MHKDATWVILLMNVWNFRYTEMRDDDYIECLPLNVKKCKQNFMIAELRVLVRRLQGSLMTVSSV